MSSHTLTTAGEGSAYGLLPMRSMLPDRPIAKIHLATGSKRETTLRFYEEAGFHHGGRTYFEVRRPWYEAIFLTHRRYL
jgi:hypothetical protein